MLKEKIFKICLVIVHTGKTNMEKTVSNPSLIVPEFTEIHLGTQFDPMEEIKTTDLKDENLRGNIKATSSIIADSSAIIDGGVFGEITDYPYGNKAPSLVEENITEDYQF